MSANKAYYILFHIEEGGATLNKAYSGKTYTANDKECLKKYAKFCEEGETPHFYKTERSAELAEIRLCNSCENVGTRYKIEEADI